ncbi:oxidoreductase-like domain-containing protein [Rhodanobacter sp. Si-c]|uniref:Oxidoreductase-like domain-containing protein n=1 Tax=Rhodanobacter lycopersici TaxID=3162487 RepID=A0ABV3QGW3_9GAMM
MSPADIPVDHPDDPRPQPPPEPDPGECCGNGCDPCIYDLYGDELERYRVALAAWRARHPDDA